MFKKLLVIFSIIFLVACQQKNSDVDNHIIKVGTIAGPDVKILEVVKDVAKKKYGLDIQIVEFTDYALPNTALNDGSIHANIFQHQPYLDATVQAKHYPLVAIGKTFIFPMGIYSDKIKNIKDIAENAVVAIPNDPSNEARALILLAQTGVISLKHHVGFAATIHDIEDNPKHIKIHELDAAQLPRILPDVTIAIINSNYAIPAGLSPKKDAIYLENQHSPYVNIIVVREADKNNASLQTLVKAFQTSEVKAAAKEIFAGEAIVGWK